jgi:hypothetical protein
MVVEDEAGSQVLRVPQRSVGNRSAAHKYLPAAKIACSGVRREAIRSKFASHSPCQANNSPKGGRIWPRLATAALQGFDRPGDFRFTSARFWQNRYNPSTTAAPF